MLLYVIIFIAAIWGIFTLIAINEEDKEIKEMVQSARRSTMPSHGSEWFNSNIQYNKQHRKEQVNMNYGTVKFFNDEKGFGFIAVENGEDIFVHFSNIEGTGRRSLATGQEVEFEIGQGQKGLEAKNVKPV